MVSTIVLFFYELFTYELFLQGCLFMGCWVVYLGLIAYVWTTYGCLRSINRLIWKALGCTHGYGC